MIQVLKDGYRLALEDLPNLTSFPSIDSTPRSPEKFTAMQDLITNLLVKGVIEEVHNHESKGFYSRFFLVPKKEVGKWRAILDLSVLNKYIHKQKFKMETAESIREHLMKGEWATSLDLSDAYHHVPIHRAHRRYLRFCFNGKIYQYKALVMGLTSSPGVFTRAIKCLKKPLQQWGVKLHQYLDDWIIHGSSYQEVVYHTQVLLQLVRALGFLPNLEKSDLIPAQDITFLSYRFLLDQGKVSPTESRWEKIQLKILPFLHQKTCTARQFQSLLGLLASTERLVHLGLLHMRPLQVAMLKVWSPFRDDPNQKLFITDQFKQNLKWWTVRENVMAGVPIVLPPPQHQVFTDACTTGWGGTLSDVGVQGKWSIAEKDFHINVLELLAAWKTLQYFVHQIQNSVVMVATDNTTAVAYIRRQGGTRSSSLLKLTQELFAWTEEHSITLVARHIAGRLNVLADGLSRGGQILSTEWSIHHTVLEYLWLRWEKPMVDLFATRHNNKLPIFVSPVSDDRAWAVDALSISWDGLQIYAFPPTAILTKVLMKLRDHECDMILIAPNWPKQRWFPLILEHLVDYPVSLPYWPHLLKQPQSELFHQNPQVYQLHAWKLSTRHTLVEAFLARLRKECHRHRRQEASKSTRESGGSTAIGVKEGIWIHSKPLL